MLRPRSWLSSLSKFAPPRKRKTSHDRRQAIETLECRIALGDVGLTSLGMLSMSDAFVANDVAGKPTDQSDSESDSPTDSLFHNPEADPPDQKIGWPGLEGAARNPGSVFRTNPSTTPPDRVTAPPQDLLDSLFADARLESALFAAPPAVSSAPPALAPLELAALPQPREIQGGTVLGNNPEAGNGGEGGARGNGGLRSQDAAPSQSVGTGLSSQMMTNIPPVAEDDNYGVLHDRQFTAWPQWGQSVLSNDSDPDGDPRDPSTASLVSGPQNGTLDFWGGTNGGFQYDPDDGFVGTDTFIYSLSDGEASDEATVTINVYNNPPVAVDGTYYVPHDTSKNIYPLSNDTDADSQDAGWLSVSIDSGPQNGTLVPLPDGDSFTYTPDPGFVGEDSIGYTVSDGAGSDQGTVTIHVTHERPIAGQDGPYGVLADAPVTISAAQGVLINDFDPDMLPGSLTAVLTRNSDIPSVVGDEGTVALNSDGSFTYTPGDPDWHGTD